MCVCVSVCVSCSLVRFSGGDMACTFCQYLRCSALARAYFNNERGKMYCRRDTHRHHYVMDMCACVPVCNYLYCTYEPNNMDIPFLELPLFLHLSLASVFIGISNVQ